MNRNRHNLIRTRIFRGLYGLLFILILSPSLSYAVSVPTISFGIDNATNPEQVSTGLQVLFLLTVLSIAPAILLMTTCFTRIVIVLGFVRMAMGTQTCHQPR